MSLSSGTRLGSYEILTLIGAGGMGEVYRAKDTKLGRNVALKILPASFTSDPERVARFRREAQVLASLNHSHIGAIYGLEESNGTQFLVLELVDGDSLDTRVARGRISVDEAIGIAKQIAEALEAAHDKGIIHRDLKPANIALTRDGSVKVLDFGLAKAVDPPSGTSLDVTNSPTIATPAAMTGIGMILGTAAYMSPEQATGRPADKRTDIWAFGCVLYELLTGRSTFAGETQSELMVAILESEPDWSALPNRTPPDVSKLLRLCLAKEQRRRLRDMGDARLILETADGPFPVGPPSGHSPIVPAVMIAAVVLFGTALWWLRPAPVPGRPVQFSFSAPEGEALEINPPVPSPDGRRIAFISRDRTDQRRLWIRAIDGTGLQRIPGSEGATGVSFWSPDGRFVGFFAQGKLKRADPSGGPALNIASTQTNLGATWGKDNVIVLAPVNRTVLHRVPASGGTPEPITTLNAARKENSHRWPHFLPDGRHFLFTARSDVKENNIVYVGSLDSREATPIIAAQSNAVYAAPGYLLFAREGTLMAQRFDARALQVSGDPFPVAANIGHTTASSSAMFSASADGSVLGYQPAVPRTAHLTWFDRAGRRMETFGPEREYTEVRLAPNGRYATVVIPDPESGNRDIWLIDTTGGNLTRVTSNPANDWNVAWSPDSHMIAFASDRNGRSSIYRRSVDGGEEELLLQLPNDGAFPKDWWPDGGRLSISIDTAAGISQIWAMPLGGDRKPVPLNRSPAPENYAMVSPDGSWIAYESDESGLPEIYAKRVEGSSKLRLSDAGGILPKWRRDGRELFYVAPNRELMAVGIEVSNNGTTIEAARPRRLFTACADMSPNTQVVATQRVTYDVAADGKRFLLACVGPDAKSPTITISVDWMASLK